MCTLHRLTYGDSYSSATLRRMAACEIAPRCATQNSSASIYSSVNSYPPHDARHHHRSLANTGCVGIAVTGSTPPADQVPHINGAVKRWDSQQIHHDSLDTLVASIFINKPVSTAGTGGSGGSTGTGCSLRRGTESRESSPTNALPASTSFPGSMDCGAGCDVNVPGSLIRRTASVGRERPAPWSNLTVQHLHPSASSQPQPNIGSSRLTKADGTPFSGPFLAASSSSSSSSSSSVSSSSTTSSSSSGMSRRRGDVRPLEPSDLTSDGTSAAHPNSESTTTSVSIVDGVAVDGRSSGISRIHRRTPSPLRISIDSETVGGQSKSFRIEEDPISRRPRRVRAHSVQLPASPVIAQPVRSAAVSRESRRLSADYQLFEPGLAQLWNSIDLSRNPHGVTRPLHPISHQANQRLSRSGVGGGCPRTDFLGNLVF